MTQANTRPYGLAIQNEVREFFNVPSNPQNLFSANIGVKIRNASRKIGEIQPTLDSCESFGTIDALKRTVDERSER